MKKVLGKTESIGIYQQPKAANHWEDVGDNTKTYKTIQWLEAGVSIPDPDVSIDEFNSTSQNGIIANSERVFVDKTSGLPKIPFQGICDKTTLAAILAMALQTVTESGSSPYSKAFTSPTMIDFANNEGFLFTVALKQGASADDVVLLQNALINNLNIVWDLTQRGTARLMNMNGTFVGNRMTFENNFSGAPAWTNATPLQTGFYSEGKYWTNDYDQDSIFTVNNVNYASQCIRRVELQINNNVQKTCVSTGGVASNYVLSPEYKLLITLDYNSATEKILKDYTNGSLVQFFWTNDPTKAKADGSFALRIKTSLGGEGRLQSMPKVYDGEYLGLNLDSKIYSIGTTGAAINIDMVDSIKWGF